MMCTFEWFLKHSTKLLSRKITLIHIHKNAFFPIPFTLSG